LSQGIAGARDHVDGEGAEEGTAVHRWGHGCGDPTTGHDNPARAGIERFRHARIQGLAPRQIEASGKLG